MNMLTGTAVETLSQIAARHPEARAAIAKVLKDAYPAPPKEPDVTRTRYCQILARKVHAALNAVYDKSIPFPKTYDEAARTRLRQLW